jgi:hypothetical protein
MDLLDAKGYFFCWKIGKTFNFVWFSWAHFNLAWLIFLNFLPLKVSEMVNFASYTLRWSILFGAHFVFVGKQCAEPNDLFRLCLRLLTFKKFLLRFQLGGHLLA